MAARRFVVVAVLALVAAIGLVPTAGAAQADRVAGPSRFATSVAIAQRAFPDGADTVYLARGDAFADALAAGTLTDGPVLLVPSCGEPPPETPAEIARLDPDTVIALGGANAVCDPLLTTLAAGRATDRLAAPDRFGTAAAIAARAFPDGAEVVYLANAADSPDAVAGGALTDGPILLVPADGTPPGTVTATLQRLDPATVVALGGANAVAEDTLTATAAGRPTARVAGASRFDTAAAIATRAFPPTGDVASAYLARGDVFADAVASGSLTDGPVLLVGSCGPLPDAVTTYLTEAAAGTVTALGGTQAVCDQVLTDAANLGTDAPPPPPEPTPTPEPTPQPPTPTPTPPVPDDPFAGTEVFFSFSSFNSYAFDTARVTTEFDESFALYFTMTADGSQFLWTDLDDIVQWHDSTTREQIATTPLPAQLATSEPAQPSSDGTYLSFRGEPDGVYPGSAPMYVVDRRGEDVLDDDPDTLTFIGGVTDHVWSAQDDLFVTLTSPDGAPQLVRFRVDDDAAEVIREYPAAESLPTDLAVSPDGTQMLYTYLEHLWRVDLATGEHVQLTTSGFEEIGPTFSPDGRHVLFQIAVGLSGPLTVMPNGDYPDPVRVEPYDDAEEFPTDAPFAGVLDEDGRVIDAGDRSNNYWFPAR